MVVFSDMDASNVSTHGDTMTRNKKEGNPRYRVKRGHEYESVPDHELTNKAILTGFRELSSSHGFPQIYNAPGGTKRAVWLVILLATIGALIYNLEQITSKFFKYDVEASVYIHNVNKQQFPAVTLCNMSPFKASLVATNEAIASILGINEEKRRRREIKRQNKKEKERVYREKKTLEWARKRRKKRYVKPPTCTVGANGNFDPSSGICFGLATFKWFDNEEVTTHPWDTQVTNCETQSWELAVVDTQAKLDFLRNQPLIFTPGATDDTGTTNYWLRLRYVSGYWRWGSFASDTVITFSAWAPGMPLNSAAHPCGYADASNNHMWYNADCNDYKMGLCEKNTGLVSTNEETEGTTMLSTSQAVTTETPTTTADLTTLPEMTQLLTTETLATTADLSTLPETTQLLTTETATTTTDLSTLPETTHLLTTETATTTTDLSTLPETTQQLTTEKPTTTADLTTFPETTKKLTTDIPTTVADLTTLPDVTTEDETTIPDLTTTHQLTTQPDTTTQQATVEITDSETITLPETTNGEVSTEATTHIDAAVSDKSSTELVTESNTIRDSDTATASSVAGTRDSNYTTPSSPPLVTVHVPPPIPDPEPVPNSQIPGRILQEEEFIKETQTYEALSFIDEEEKKSVGYEADKFIIDCQFAGYLCYPWQFSYFYNSIHGNCYIFNSGWNESEHIKWSFQVGRRYALKVVLNIDQDEYLMDMGQEAGARVVIQHQDKMPFPEDEGIMAKPGLLTSIGIRQVSIERKGRPYTKCFSTDESHADRNVYEEYYRVKYTNLACYKTCYQRNVIDRCGCADAGLPMKGQAFGHITVRACNSSHIIEDDCLYRVTELYAKNKLRCDCEDPCSEQYYIPQVSHSRWPADKHVNEFLSSHASQLLNLINSSEPKKYEENLVKVEVYFETFEYERIVEVPSYRDSVFIGDVGGTFGLWVGWSFITVFEFLELFVDLIVQGCRRKSQRASKRQVPALHEEATPSQLSRRSESYLKGSHSRQELENFRRMNTLKLPEAPRYGYDGLRDSGISSACSNETEVIDSHDLPSRVSRDSYSRRSRTTRSTHGTNLLFPHVQ